MFARFPDHFLQSYGGPPEKIPAVYRERSSRYHAASFAKLPVVIVHGSADAIIPVNHSRILVEQLRAMKKPVFYVEIKDGDHDSLTKTDIAPVMDYLAAATREPLTPEPG